MTIKNKEQMKFKMVGKQRIYICYICKKNTLKSELIRLKGLCSKCYDKEDVYQIFDNGKYKKLEMENLWGYLMEDSLRKLFGLFLTIPKYHKDICIARLDGNFDNTPEFIETGFYKSHIKIILKILEKSK